MATFMTASATVPATTSSAASTATMTPPLETPHHGSVSMGAPARYQALRCELSDIDEELKRMNAVAAENKDKYDKLRDEKKHSIDVEMKERHKAE